MGLIMECVTINPPVSPDRVTVLQSWRSSCPTIATMTSWCGRCEATKQEVSGKVCEPRPGSCIQQRSAELLAAHWCGWAPVSAVLHCLGFSKTNSYWKGTVRTVVFSAGSFKKRKKERKKNSSHLVFLFMRKSWWKKMFFSSLVGIVVYEVRERKSIKERQHWKQDFLKRPSQCRPCAVIWSVLTELSRGMEKIIRRNVWGALKWSGPRDWPIGVRPTERRANFFLMNSTACSTMQSDCQGWTHIWSVFGGSKWQDQFCLQRKGGVGVGRRWLLLAPPSFFFFSFFFLFH